MLNRSSIHFYRPQTKFAKVMFLHLSVSHSVHRGGEVGGGGCLGPHPGGKLRGLARGVSRLTSRGEVEGSGHGGLGPHPGGKLRGLPGQFSGQGGFLGPQPGGKLRYLARGVSRPTPRGGLGGLAWGVSRPTPGGVSQHALRQIPPAYGYCCERYSSYWNAFLLTMKIYILINVGFVFYKSKLIPYLQ